MRLFTPTIQSFIKNPIISLVIIISILITIITVVQDYCYAMWNNGGFYIEESLLFKMMWLLFIPSAIFLLKILPSISISNKVVKIGVGVGGVLIFSTIHLFLFVFFVYGFAYMFFYAPFQFRRIVAYTFGNYFFIFLFFYGVLWYLKLKKSTKTNNIITVPNLLSIILVKYGSKVIPIDVNTICFIQTATPFLSLSSNGKKYYYQSSLNKLKAQLDPNQFLQIHRSTLINIDCIKELHSRQNGDYDVIVKSGEVLRLSRRYREGLLRRWKI